MTEWMGKRADLGANTWLLYGAQQFNQSIMLNHNMQSSVRKQNCIFFFPPRKIRKTKSRTKVLELYCM